MALLCATVMDGDPERVERLASEALAMGASLVEVRVDALGDPELVTTLDLPLARTVLTLRSPAQVP